MESKSNENTNKAGCIGLGLSFLSPLFAIIFYILGKEKVVNPKAYLYAALYGFIFWLIFSVCIAVVAAVA